MSTKAMIIAVATVLLRGGDPLKAYATRLGAEGLALKEGDEVIAMIKSVSINESGISKF